MNKNFTQAAVALVGMIGLVSLSGLSFFVSGMEDERSLLIGGLIATVGTSAAWLFRLNGANAVK